MFCVVSLADSLAKLLSLGGHGAQQAVPGDGDASAVFIKNPQPGRAGPGVLCLHGFSGTPFEVRPLALGLAQQQGFTVLAPVLAGHGHTAEALALTRWQDWLASAEAALDRLLGEVDGPVAIAGFSLGGLLALRLARLRPHDVAALAILAAPLRLGPTQTRAMAAIQHLPAALRRGPLAFLPKRDGFDVTDEDMKRRNPGLPALPLVGVASLLELGTVVRRDLPFLTLPTLVAHGDKDHTVPIEDSLEILGSLGSQVVERLWLRQSGHLLALDVERATLIEAVGRFFGAHLAAAVST